MNTSSNSPSIVDLSSESVAFIQQGQYGRASGILVEALEMMKAHLGPSVEDAASVHGEGTQMDIGNFDIQTVDVFAPVGRPGCQSGTQDMLVALYGKALTIADPPKTTEEKAITLMVLLYDLGLANHLQALSMPTCTISSRSLLNRAAKLYQSAIQTAHTFIQDYVFRFHFLLLATANNLAHVYSENLESANVCQCVSMMRRIISYPLLAGDGDLLEDDYAFFETNVITFLESPLLSVAPAA